jgi:hypothetical protein
MMKHFDRASLPFPLNDVQGFELRGAAEGDDRPREEVELHRESDPKTRAVLRRVLGEEPVREEETPRVVSDVEK